MSTLGAILTQARLTKEQSCRQVALAVGLSASHLWRIEHEMKIPRLDEAQRLCSYLGLSLAIFDQAIFPVRNVSKQKRVNVNTVSE